MTSRTVSLTVCALKLAEDDTNLSMSLSNSGGKKSKLLVLYILLIHLTSTSCNSINLNPSGVLKLCPGSNIKFVCTNNLSTVLAWRSYEQDYPEGDPYFFNHGSEVSMEERFSGSFALVLISASPLISTATLTNNFGPRQNGANLTCSSTTSTNPKPTQRKYAVLVLKDAPSAPLKPEFSPKSLTSAILSWTPPNNNICVNNYTITLTNITDGNKTYTYNTTTNTTSMTVSELTQGAEYSFTVAGVDGGGRVGEESVPSQTVMLNTPQRVSELRYQQRYFNETFANITLWWKAPSPSPRPPVVGYNVSHNVTGTVQVYITNDTHFSIITMPSERIVFAVTAINVLGNGEESSIKIIVASLNTSSKPTSISTTPISSTIATKVSSSIVETRISIVQTSSSPLQTGSVTVPIASSQMQTSSSPLQTTSSLQAVTLTPTLTGSIQEQSSVTGLGPVQTSSSFVQTSSRFVQTRSSPAQTTSDQAPCITNENPATAQINVDRLKLAVACATAVTVIAAAVPCVLVLVYILKNQDVLCPKTITSLIPNPTKKGKYHLTRKASAKESTRLC